MEKLALGRRALDVFPFPALLIDKDYQVVFMNKRAKELYTQSDQVCYQISHSFFEPYTADPLPVGEKITKADKCHKYRLIRSPERFCRCHHLPAG